MYCLCVGPKLPYALAQEMGTKRGEAGLQGSKRGQSMFLISQRKEARKAARHAKKQRKPMHKAGHKRGLTDQHDMENEVIGPDLAG